jgi:hypothetical protein
MYSSKVERMVHRHHRWLRSGNFRSVFEWGEGYVLKVPLSNSGALHNLKEAAVYKQYGPNNGLAPCCLMRMRDVPLLIMERVTPLCSDNVRLLYKEHPYVCWMNRLTDGFQVGRREDGSLVLYDYGHWPSEIRAAPSDDHELPRTPERIIQLIEGVLQPYTPHPAQLTLFTS